MISIIICARQHDIPAALKDNIRDTIGVPYEIVAIDNSENRHTIFSAYNQGVAMSRYPLLLFMHDDIYYHTQDWGQKVIDHFSDPRVGGIGVAGTHYLAYTPGAWWSSGVGHLYLLQTTQQHAEPEMHHYLPHNPAAGEEVVVLDGVWFGIRRELFEKVRFDEGTFSGFHFYDVDTTLQISQLGYKLICIKDILIHHLSMGVLNDTWVQNAFLFHQKWKDKLPVSLVKYSLGEQCAMEYRVLNELMSTQLQSGQTKKSRIYLTGLKSLLRFKKGYRYIKTPVWASRLLGLYLKSVVTGK